MTPYINQRAWSCQGFAGRGGGIRRTGMLQSGQEQAGRISQARPACLAGSCRLQASGGVSFLRWLLRVSLPAPRLKTFSAGFYAQPFSFWSKRLAWFSVWKRPVDRPSCLYQSCSVFHVGLEFIDQLPDFIGSGCAAASHLQHASALQYGIAMRNTTMDGSAGCRQTQLLECFGCQL